MMSYEEFCKHVVVEQLPKSGAFSLRVGMLFKCMHGSSDINEYVEQAKKTFYESLFGSMDGQDDRLSEALVRNGELRTDLKVMRDELEAMRDKLGEDN